MNSSFKAFLALRNLEYLTIDQAFQVTELSAQAARFFDRQSPIADHRLQIGEDFRFGFPEFYGVEAELEAILNEEQTRFELKAIVRFLSDTPLYFDQGYFIPIEGLIC